MHDEALELDLDSLGSEDTYSLDFKKFKVLRKRVGAPKWVRAVTKLPVYWPSHHGLFGDHAHDMWELLLRVDGLWKKHLKEAKKEKCRKAKKEASMEKERRKKKEKRAKQGKHRVDLSSDTSWFSSDVRSFGTDNTSTCESDS